MKKITLILFILIAFVTNAQEQKKETGLLYAYYKSYSGTATITTTALSEMDSLKVHSNLPAEISNPFVVQHYDLTLVIKSNNKEAKTLYYHGKGCALSPEAKALIKQAGAGSKIYVDNISAIDVTGKIVKKISGITFNVK